MIKEGVILVISSLGIAQALFLSLYLFVVKKGNRRANIFLAIVLLALTVRIGKSIFHNYVAVDPRLRNLAISAILAVGPFLWFYGKELFSAQKDFPKQQYAHLIPFCLFALCSPIIPNRGDMASSIAYLSVFLHFAIYLGICWNLIDKLKNHVNAKLLQWYQNIVIGVTLIWGLYVGIFLRWIPFYILGAISFSFLMYLFSFLLLKRHVFMLEKYSNSNIDRVESQKILLQVRELFKEEAIYVNSSISLQSIAKKLGVTTRILSQVINENENKNFSEFVNHYRIEKSKLLLIDPKYANEKIATIAYDCGFGNVTSFNLAFKTETQMTPSAYRSQYREV